MGEAFLDYKKGGIGGLDINGIIQDYYVYAGTNVNAGDFVEFINGVAGQTAQTSTDTAISTVKYSGNKISACKLTENKVFVAYNSDDTSMALNAIIITINKATITCGSSATLVSTTNSGTNISVVALSDTLVFIAYGKSGYLYGLVCTINGTTMTAGTDAQIGANKYTSKAISTVLLSNNKVFIAHSSGASYYLYGTVCTISGTTITKGTSTAIHSYSENALKPISVALLTSTKVFIAYSATDPYYLYGIVCTISGTTITSGTEKQFDCGTTNVGLSMSTVALSSTKVFIWHTRGSSCVSGALVCTISGTTITQGTDVSLISSKNTGYSSTCLLLDNGNVLITHTYTDSYYLTCGMVSVSGTTPTLLGTQNLSTAANAGYVSSPILIANDRAFIAHSKTADYHLYGQMWGIDKTNNKLVNQIISSTYETQVRPATILPCDGVSSTSGAGGTSTGHKDKVSVYVPDV